MPDDAIPSDWCLPSLSAKDIADSAAAFDTLREIAATIRRLDKIPFVAGQFDSSRLLKTLRDNYPDVVDSIDPPPSTPITLDQVTASERSELESLPRHARRALAREVLDATAKATGCGALRSTPLSRIIHCAPLFAVWQKIKYRLIYDLRAFNTHSLDPTFDMETVADIPTIARGCNVGSKIDLKSAYWQVPLHTDLQAYMGCEVDGRSMTWRCLPFGLAIAPRIFTMTIRPLVLAWRSRGIRVLAYLDDIAVFASDPATHARRASRPAEH